MEQNLLKKDGFESNGVSDFIKEREKKDEFKSNGVSDLIGEKKKKDGVWTNGRLESSRRTKTKKYFCDSQ